MKRKPAYKVDFAQLKRVVPLTAILSRYGLDAFKRVGSRLKGACPIHKGSNARQFVIDPNASTWRCFGDCNRGGGSLEFVAEMEHVGIIEAATLIAGWFAVPLEPSRSRNPTERRPTVSGGKPSHKAYVVEDRGEGDDNDAFWTRIGSAWPHKDGKGLNIVMQAVPINGRLVLREYTDEDAKVDEEKQKKVAKRK
ncbi:MAG: CHC2 zinc finger domain-containing protein [Hyphomicrobium sp.]